MSKITWRKFWERDYTYQYVECLLSALTSCLEQEKIKSFKNMLFIRKNGGSSIYSKTNEHEYFIKQLHVKFLSNKNEIIKFKQRLLKTGKDYFLSAQVAKNVDLAKISQQKLLSLLKVHYQSWLNFTVRIWVVWNSSEYFSELLGNLLAEKTCQFGQEVKLPQYLKFVSTPIKNSSILLLNEKLNKYKAGKKIDLNKLYKDFLWMPCGDLHGEPWNKEQFLDYVNNFQLSKNDGIKALDPGKDLKLNAEERLLIKVNKEMAYLRDYRDEIRRRTVYFARFLFQEVARRWQIPYEDLMFYSTPEVFELFKGHKLLTHELQARRGDTIIIIKNKKMKVLFGKESDKFMKDITPVDNSAVKQITGLVASKGNVWGIAKIISLDSDLKKINQGDIMVAVTTHPEYVIKMQLASAIVTDEGGLTCHAAIVAREMKKPCIVGTKIATKVLKDGDKIEVDAENGVVRKLS